MWPVALAGGGHYVVRGRDLRGCDEPLPPAVAEAMLDRMMRDTAARAEVLQLYEAVGGPPLGHRAHIDDAAARRAILTRLRQAFERRELCLCRVEPLMGVGGAVEEETTRGAAAGGPPESRKKTWVEVRLVDMEGNPVPNKHYLITLPDGRTEEGYLDGAGRVRVDNADPGNCIITFPDLDREAWEWA